MSSHCLLKGSPYTKVHSEMLFVSDMVGISSICLLIVDVGKIFLWNMPSHVHMEDTLLSDTMPFETQLQI
jgi:hypothetical protein